MKRAVIAATILLLVIATCITASAANIKVDGDINNKEWEGSESKELDNYLAGNDTHDLRVKCYYPDKSTAYYAFSFYEDVAGDCSQTGFKFVFDGIGEIKVDSDSPSYEETDNENYRIVVCLRVNATDNIDDVKRTVTAGCEVMIDYKNGTGASAGGKVWTVNHDGQFSDYNDFSFKNSHYTEETTEAEDNTSKTAKETTTKRRRVTRETTTGKPISTSRVVTTERATTAKKATTTQKVTTEKATAVKTTKAKTTKAGTTKAKHAIGKAAEADEVSVSVVTSIVYVVPETIISGTVYVTDETEQGNEKSAFDIKNMQKSTVMKIAAGGAALLLFGAIGIAAVKNKKDNGKDDTGTE